MVHELGPPLLQEGEKRRTLMDDGVQRPVPKAPAAPKERDQSLADDSWYATLCVMQAKQHAQ